MKTTHFQPITNKPNPWKRMTIILGIILMIQLVYDLQTDKTNDMVEEQINLVDQLIENQIVFVYSSGCSACHKQIEIFGEDWDRYFQTGLTIDCGSQSSVYCQNITATPSWRLLDGTIIGVGVIQ